MQPNMQPTNDPLLQIALRSEVQPTVNRMMALVDQYRNSTPAVAAAALTIADDRLHSASQTLETHRDYSRNPLYQALLADLKTARARMESHSPIESPEPPAHATVLCVSTIALVTALDHHRTRASHSRNTDTALKHIEAAYHVVAAIQAASLSHNSADNSKLESLELLQEALQATQLAAETTPLIDMLRRSHLTILYSPAAESINEQSTAARQTARAFQQSSMPIHISPIAGSPPGPASDIQFLIAYIHADTIHCQLIGEPYPTDFSAQDAREHAYLIFEQAHQLSEHSDPRAQVIYQSLAEAAQHTAAIAEAGLQSSRLDFIEDALDFLKSQGADPQTIAEVSVIIAGGNQHIAAAIRAASPHEALLTEEQALALATAADETDVHPNVLNAIAEFTGNHSLSRPPQPFHASPEFLKQFNDACVELQLPDPTAAALAAYLTNQPEPAPDRSPFQTPASSPSSQLIIP